MQLKCNRLVCFTWDDFGGLIVSGKAALALKCRALILSATLPLGESPSKRRRGLFCWSKNYRDCLALEIQPSPSASLRPSRREGDMTNLDAVDFDVVNDKVLILERTGVFGVFDPNVRGAGSRCSEKAM